MKGEWKRFSFVEAAAGSFGSSSFYGSIGAVDAVSSIHSFCQSLVQNDDQ